MVEGIHFGQRGFQSPRRQRGHRRPRDEREDAPAGDAVEIEHADLDIDALLDPAEHADLQAIARRAGDDTARVSALTALKQRLAFDKYQARQDGSATPHFNLAWLNRLHHDLERQRNRSGIDADVLQLAQDYLVEKLTAAKR